MKYRINFINNSYRRFFRRHFFELLWALIKCLWKGDLVLREEVSKFEDNLAKYTGTKYGIGVGSGTDALVLSLKALGIGPGDEVIVPAHTFIASIYCVKAVGATPILIDVGQDELMDVDQLEGLITERTKAIIPVHFHGKVCNMQMILAIAKEYNLFVIEDAAQALGSSYALHISVTIDLDTKEIQNTKLMYNKAGSFGDLGCFSFNTPKLMGGWGDGGGIVTNNRELAERLYLLRNHWNMAQTSVRIADFPTPEVVEWAGKSRLDNIQAAMLNVKWKYYPKLLKRRKEIADMYCKGLDGLPLKLPTYGEGDVIQEFIIRIGDPKTREELKVWLDKHGIEVLIRETTPNHKVHNLGLNHFSLPVTESISLDAVRLPCYPELRNREIKKIIKTIREFYGRR